MKPGTRRACLVLAPLLVAAYWLTHHTPARAEEKSVRLDRQEISVEIDDRRGLAITNLVQEVVNRGGDDAPASLDLPLRDDAALMRFAVTAPTARKKEDPASLGSISAAGRNLYRVTLKRVPAHGRARFELRYAETLTRRGTRRKYVYPFPTRGEAVPAGFSLRARITGRTAPQNVTSTSYPLLVRPYGASSVLASYDSTRPPDGHDIVIDYQAPPDSEDSQARLAVLPATDPREDPYFLLTLPSPAALFHGSRTLDQPVDVVFCLDVSGSTSGRKANTIREAIHDGLSDLTPRDRFGIVAYDDDARAMHRFLVPASTSAVNFGMRFVNRIRPSGGSEPGRGLAAALQILSGRSGKERKPIIAIVADAEDTADLAAQVQRLGLAKRGIRVVALGALRDSRTVHYTLSGQKLRQGPAIALSRAALTYGAAMSGATFDPGPLNASYLYPTPDHLPQLPLSTPVTFLGRLNEAPPAHGTIALTGKLEGAQRTLPVEFVVQPLDPNTPIPALWANRRVRRLQQLTREPHRNPVELQQATADFRAEHPMPAVPAP